MELANFLGNQTDHLDNLFETSSEKCEGLNMCICVLDMDYESFDKSRLVERLVYLSLLGCRQHGTTRLVQVVDGKVD